MLCHGKGDDGQGCCFIRGQVCPLRWRLDGGHVYSSDDSDLGTVQAFIESIIHSKPGRDKAYAQLEGVRFACRAAVEVLVDDARLLNDRPGFEAAWMAHPDYVSLVAPEWREIELDHGLPAGTLDCAAWHGTGGSQCCFSQSQAENDADATDLSVEARTLRGLGGT